MEWSLRDQDRERSGVWGIRIGNGVEFEGSG